MPQHSRLRSLARAIVPVRTRRLVRRVASQAPRRALDLPRDAIAFAFPRAFGAPLPPPGLRSRVGGVARSEFERVGREGARGILEAFAKIRMPGRAYPSWLDFGCGCGRIARKLTEAPEVERLTGLDVDASLIGWAARNLSGQFSVMRPTPPLSLATDSFDVVYAISIFTHYTEPEQRQWLQELRRVLRPGGLLIATTISPWQAGRFPGILPQDFESLSRRGFLCVNGDSPVFNERTTFHSPEYLASEWGRWMTPRLFNPYGLVEFQDLSVWEKPEAPQGSGSAARGS